jgi:hypothetical protein
MPFTVHPAETQAMQEDEAQLLTAIAQTTRSALGWLRQTQPQIQPKPETPEIHMHGRQIYGAMANGQFRNELNAERLQTILDALQQPVTEGIDPKRYKGKPPKVEIRDAGIILFRQEKDGVVTVNQFQHQLQNEQTAQTEPAHQATPEPRPASGLEL